MLPAPALLVVAGVLHGVDAEVEVLGVGRVHVAVAAVDDDLGRVRLVAALLTLLRVPGHCRGRRESGQSDNGESELRHVDVSITS